MHEYIKSKYIKMKKRCGIIIFMQPGPRALVAGRGGDRCSQHYTISQCNNSHHLSIHRPNHSTEQMQNIDPPEAVSKLKAYLQSKGDDQSVFKDIGTYDFKLQLKVASWKAATLSPCWPAACR